MLSKKEIEKFKELIVKSENVMKKIVEKSENFINTLKNNYQLLKKKWIID